MLLTIDLVFYQTNFDNNTLFRIKKFAAESLRDYGFGEVRDDGENVVNEFIEPTIASEFNGEDGFPDQTFFLKYTFDLEHMEHGDLANFLVRGIPILKERILHSYPRMRCRISTNYYVRMLPIEEDGATGVLYTDE